MKHLVALILSISVLGLASMPVAAADGLVTARGSGIADGERFPSPMPAKLLSRRAAMADAQRNLLETINGVRITSGTTVENMMVKSDKIGSRVKGMIQGAFVLDENVMEDSDSWITEVTLGVCVNRSHPKCGQPPTLQQAVAEAIAEGERVTPYRRETVPASANEASASGLIVDASAMEMTPFLDVRIRTPAGEELYGPSIVDLESGSDWLNFAPSVEAARGMSALVGDTPMLVTAEDVEAGSVVVVSADDAARVYGANDSGAGFLRQGRVVFVLSQ